MRTKHLWLSVVTGAAVGAASYYLKKKLSSAPAAAPGAAAVPSPAPAAPSAVAKEAVYSFISGFKNAATVEFRFDYDADRFHYAVAEDDFLTESGDSHVGILTGEDFSVQFEYGAYYSGEDFDLLTQELSSRHPDLDQAVYGGLSGVKFRDGDNFCLAFPVPEDAHSYMLITLVKAPDNDDELETIPDTADFRTLLNSGSLSVFRVSGVLSVFLRDFREPSQTVIHSRLADRGNSQISQLPERCVRILDPQLRHRSEALRQSPENPRFLQEKDVIDLFPGGAHCLADVGRLAIDAPVDAVAQVLENPLILHIQHADSRTHQIEKIHNVRRILEIHNIELLAKHNLGLFAKTQKYFLQL